MKESVSFDKDFFKKYVAVISDDESSSPKVFTGVGETEEEALGIARGKYEQFKKGNTPVSWRNIEKVPFARWDDFIEKNEGDGKN